MALAPSRALLSVPSRSTSRRSTPRWSSASKSASASRISPFTLSTAVRTPLPPKRSPPSLSSTASKVPVEGVEAGGGQVDAPGLGQALHLVEPSQEGGGGAPQGRLRV